MRKGPSQGKSNRVLGIPDSDIVVALGLLLKPSTAEAAGDSGAVRTLAPFPALGPESSGLSLPGSQESTELRLSPVRCPLRPTARLPPTRAHRRELQRAERTGDLRAAWKGRGIGLPTPSYGVSLGRPGSCVLELTW